MIKKILIDARESGTTTGRYIDKLIETICANTATKTVEVHYFKTI